MIAARSANENLTPLDVMLAVMRDPQVSLADRVKMALKALPRLHRKPKAGQSGNAIAGSRAATVQSFGTPKEAAGGGTGKDAAATERDPIGGTGKKGPTASSTPPPEESQKSTAGAEEGGKCPGLMPLDFLLSVIQHPKTPAALQVKVSLATLPYIHPKQSSRAPKPAVVADRYGFEVDPALAKKLRNKIARLAQLNRRRSPHPGDQKTIQRLHQEANLMIAALQCPCPSRYRPNAFSESLRNQLSHNCFNLPPSYHHEIHDLSAYYRSFP